MISVHFQGKPFNFTVIQVSVSTIKAAEVEIKWFYEDLQGLLELTHTHTQNVLFTIGDCSAKRKVKRYLE